MSWLCFLDELVKIVATKKIVADQNFECATWQKIVIPLEK
jgi:hypothetical protein